MAPNTPNFEAAKRSELAVGSKDAATPPSDRERANEIFAVCEAAMQIERAKLQSGLPASMPAPWPKSTWEFLKQCAPNAQAK